MVVLLRSCCYVLTLRQGTMLIAVIELLMSVIGFFLLILGTIHAQEITAILEDDIEENDVGRSCNSKNDDNGSVYVLPPHHNSNNEIRLHDGQHMSQVVVNVLHLSIIMITFHLMISIALMYGSIMVVRQSLLPWIGVTIIELIIVLASITVCDPVTDKTVAILLATGMFILFRLCLLVTVFSYYCQLNTEQGSSCTSLEDQDATSIKAGYPQIPPPGKPSDV